jgi:hypothetical protein
LMAAMNVVDGTVLANIIERNDSVTFISADTLSVLQVGPVMRVPGSRRGDHRDPGRVGVDAGERCRCRS